MYIYIEAFGYLIRIYTYIILAYVLVGYFPEARGSKIYQILARLCEPLLNVFRFATVSGISFAPILAVVFLEVLYQLMRVIYGM
ncbi:YggT family protein [Mycoplasmatota bacterium]|nr:YggT family protein [Mycoplasmatota bacterium]